MDKKQGQRNVELVDRITNPIWRVIGCGGCLRFIGSFLLGSVIATMLFGEDLKEGVRFLVCWGLVYGIWLYGEIWYDRSLKAALGPDEEDPQ